jgi:hypothetical protein
MRLFDFTGMLIGLMPLLDVAGDGTGGGGDGTGGTGTGVADGDAAKPGVGGQGTGDGLGAAPKPGVGGKQEPTVKFEDDPRFKGVLNDLAKERKARQKHETDLATERAALATERKRVLALAGAEPKSEQDAADEAVRERFKQLYPKLGSLDDAKLDRLLAMADNADSFEAATTHHWQTHGRKMLDTAVAGMQKALGGDLTDRQKNRLEKAYFNEASSNPEFLARHEAGDIKLVDDFVKEFIEDFVEPGRRKALADEQSRMRRVPSSRDRSVVGQGGKKLDLSKDEDFAEAAAASFKGHGGAFGER